MALRRRQKEQKIQFANAQANDETDVEVDIKELVYNMEDVRNSVRICIDFGKENDVELINPKGKAVVAEMWRKYTAQSRVISVVDERIEKRLAPIEQKQDQMMQMLEKMANIVSGVSPDMKPDEPQQQEPRKEQQRRRMPQALNEKTE